MIFNYLIMVNCFLAYSIAYKRSWYDNENQEHADEYCGKSLEEQTVGFNKRTKNKLAHVVSKSPDEVSEAWSFGTAETTYPAIDPFKKYQDVINELLLGSAKEDREENSSVQEKIKINFPDVDIDLQHDTLAQYPSGNIMRLVNTRAELFQNKTSVHLPMAEFIHRGHSYLRITSDYMQTAVNAFSIFLHGNLEDVLRLPADYVLKSAKTIAMMKIEKEKLAATWSVVKGDNDADEISYRVLEMYRPLFKYLNGREMARLNLSDDRILTFIGTHADLDRHQVGVVAGKYIKFNPRWMEPRYLNLMNNLLCGVPMTFMRRIPENTYLQLTHQIFYHINACDPLQRRFYLAMMTRTQALGKSYSWSARDVSRLGLLLSEIEGSDLAAVNPEAMSGITAQVMLEIPPQSLKHITEMQLRFIGQKPLNILAKRLRVYQDQQRLFNKGYCLMILKTMIFVTFVILI